MEVGADLCFPQLLNSSCRRPSISWPEALLLHVTLSSVSLLTVALNLLVIIAVSHFRQLHTPTNVLLLSLAVSDLLVGLLLMPVEILLNTSCWFLGDLACSLYSCVSFIITSASIGDMVLISLDRYVAICDPLRYSGRMTQRRAQLCVCLCWFTSVCYNTLFLRDELRSPGRAHTCQGECVIFLDFAEGTVDLVLSFVAPIAAIIVLYSRVFVVAVSQARAVRSRVAAVTLRVSVAPGRKLELKAARTLGVLVLVFLLCFCPYYGLSVTGGQLSHGAVSFVVFLFYFNSCLNPLIYAMFYPWFRRAVRLIVTLQVLQPGSREAKIL